MKATLRFLKLTDGSELELSPALKASADLEVFERISVIPPRRILAWDPVTQPRHEIKYTATGSAQVTSYQYVSSNSSFAAIAQSGLAKTQGMGWCSISAFVPKYPHVRGDAAVPNCCFVFYNYSSLTFLS